MRSGKHRKYPQLCTTSFKHLHTLFRKSEQHGFSSILTRTAHLLVTTRCDPRKLNFMIRTLLKYLCASNICLWSCELLPRPSPRAVNAGGKQPSDASPSYTSTPATRSTTSVSLPASSSSESTKSTTAASNSSRSESNRLRRVR